jgi:hypothetical protein
LIEATRSAAYSGGGAGGPFIMYTETGVPSDRVEYWIEKYGLITSMWGVSVTAGSDAGVSVGISNAYALLHNSPVMVNINTVTTNKVNRILYFTAALVFIFYP